MSPVLYTLSAATNENATFAPSARDHRPRNLRLGRKTHIIWHIDRRHAIRIVCPNLRQIERPVDKRMAVARHIRGKHPDLANGDLTRRARVLAGHPARRLALLQKASLVYDENRIVIGAVVIWFSAAAIILAVYGHDVQ